MICCICDDKMWLMLRFQFSTHVIYVCFNRWHIHAKYIKYQLPLCFGQRGVPFFHHLFLFMCSQLWKLNTCTGQSLLSIFCPLPESSLCRFILPCYTLLLFSFRIQGHPVSPIVLSTYGSSDSSVLVHSFVIVQFYEAAWQFVRNVWH